MKKNKNRDKIIIGNNKNLSKRDTMLNNSSVKKLNIRRIGVALVVMLLLLCAVFLWVGNSNSVQSEAPMIAGVRFYGEYMVGDGDWQPIEVGKHIPATRGDVTLKGHFQLIDPTNGTPVSRIAAGTEVSLYLNHLGAYIPLENGKLYFECENDMLGDDACAIMRGFFTVQDEEDIVIVLQNPHRYGNENAIDEFLANMSIAPGIYLEKADLERGENSRAIGIIVLMVSIIILGIAFFSAVIHIRYSKEIWLIGFMSLFAGGYFLFDAFGVSLWNDSYITNTRVLGICMMLYMLFCITLIASTLKGRLKAISNTVVLIMGACVAVCVLMSLAEGFKFYDTWAYWTALQTIGSLVLMVCIILSFKGSTLSEKFLYSAGMIALAAFITDAIATYVGAWCGGFLSKHVFLLIFAIALVVVLRIIPSHINAGIKSKELEAEQQALKLELQESRISIMLSQMQPHFIFNTLNTIYHLCEINPSVARSTISSFSEYLRNNIDTLGQSEMISFEKELSFVKTYLEIEKVRFDDELEIILDIQTMDFKLPVLTVQPIVENAVKHGTSKKEGVAQLYISTRENDDCYEIVIRDTGVGFDTGAYRNDGHKHVGISSVKQRLDNLCGGTLNIESKVGVGTTATVKIPKKEG